jgi:hypothetical protein
MCGTWSDTVHFEWEFATQKIGHLQVLYISPQAFNTKPSWRCPAQGGEILQNALEVGKSVFSKLQALQHALHYSHNIK